ncbi:unnamed protein product [Chironomus riparius]|uniref:Uncharacterized protein n=1 Tax=Chironomus riparius TaxID=315576 RepID=A0A9N9RLF4_9DIPT|nr:unnamed protein product [Chironomus riparius]
MSTEEFSKKRTCNKRIAETDVAALRDDFDTVKTLRIIADEAIFDNSKPNDVNNIKFIDDAIKTLEDLQRNLNADCNGLESPETSDCELDDDNNGFNQHMIEGAHFLGYTACIQETLRFLDDCGIPESDPLYEQLKNHFIESSDRT